MAWGQTLSKNTVVMGLILVLGACGQASHSNLTSSSSSNSTDPTAGKAFTAAKAVMNQSCVGCHSAGGSAAYMPLDLQTEDQFVSAGLISRTKPLESNLLKRLRQYGGASSNMPPQGTSFASSEYQKILAWVKTIKPSQTPTTQFTCNESLAQRQDPMLRLKKSEFLATLNLLASYSDSYLVEKVETVEAIKPYLVLIPEDYDNEHYSTFDQSITADHVEGYYKTIIKFAERLVTLHGSYNSRFARIATTFGAVLGLNMRDGSVYCTRLTATKTENCTRQVIRAMGLAAYRRPLSTAEVDYYYSLVAPYPTHPETLKMIIVHLFSSPHFIFKLEESGAQATDLPGYKRLTDFELLTRLSYDLWGTMPTPELLKMAIDGKLSTEAGFLEVRQSMIESANLDKVKSVVRTFHENYLGYRSLPSFDAQKTNEFKFFAAGESVNVSGFAHRTDMINEMNDLLDYYTWTDPKDFSTTIKSRKYFAKTPALAKLYGDATRIWDGISDLNFNPAERAGLITRAAMVATGDHLTSPIHKGVFVYRKILCGQIGSPPPLTEEDLLVDYTPDMTTREQVHVLTVENKTNCATCHSKFNPYGYALEKYDSLGRNRVAGENLYNTNGTIRKTVPVNYGTAVTIGENTITVNSPEELSDKIAESPLVNACYVKNLFEYTKGREIDERDGCVLSQIHSQLSRPGGSMKDAFLALSAMKNYRYKKLPNP